MLVALEMAVRERFDAWTLDREIAATSVEIQHASLLAFVKANGGKNVGKPIRFPRPWEQEKQKPQKVSMSAFARMSKGEQRA